MKLSAEESIIYDETYNKVFEAVRNEEYAYMMVVNPAHLKDDVLAFANAYAKESAFEAANAAIIKLRELEDNKGIYNEY